MKFQHTKYILNSKIPQRLQIASMRATTLPPFALAFKPKKTLVPISSDRKSDPHTSIHPLPNHVLNSHTYAYRGSENLLQTRSPGQQPTPFSYLSRSTSPHKSDFKQNAEPSAIEATLLSKRNAPQLANFSSRSPIIPQYEERHRTAAEKGFAFAF